MIDRVLCETLVARDLDAAVTAWREELGWQVTARGEVDGMLAALWRTDAGDHPRYAIVASPGSDRGFIRLVEGPADDRRGTFHHAGLFNAELLCADVDALHARLERSLSFRPLCPPATYDLGSAGGAVSRSMATRGPGGAGVYFTTYLRVPPPRTLPETPQLVCAMFNSALAVDDRAESESFFEQVLGLGRRFAGYLSDHNINRLLDLPPDGGFDMVVYKGPGDGLIEVDVHDRPLPREAGADGAARRLPAAAPCAGATPRLPPGNSFLTLETADLDAVLARAAAVGRVASGPVKLDAAPYHGRHAALLRGPAGSRFELVELA